MTLREKFEDGYNDSKENAKYCEQIADDYATKFAEWLKDKPRSQFNRESLELFKKEKGL